MFARALHDRNNLSGSRGLVLTEHGVDRACPPRGCAEGVSFLTAAAAPLPRDYATPLGGFFIESAALGSESDWAFGHVSFGARERLGA